MSQTQNISKVILSAILAAAGLSQVSHGADLAPVTTQVDNETSEQILRALVGKDNPDLAAILNASSMDQLTPEQKARLLEMIQDAAKRVNHIAPLA